MSDLIIRSMYKSKLLKALDVLNKEYREALLNEDNDLILAIQNQQSAYMIALRLLDNEPTAYDIDKVVEELEKELEKGNIAIDFGEFRLFEIVKQGGVSDDVCEWKTNDNQHMFAMWETECGNQTMIQKLPSYKYCPYCGKKIKIVGD